MAKQMTESSNAPTHEQISARAYEIFIERGRPEGRDLEHWLEAEKQLRASAQANGSGPAIRTSSPANSGSQSATRTAAARARK